MTARRCRVMASEIRAAGLRSPLRRVEGGPTLP